MEKGVSTRSRLEIPWYDGKALRRIKPQFNCPFPYIAVVRNSNCHNNFK